MCSETCKHRKRIWPLTSLSCSFVSQRSSSFIEKNSIYQTNDLMHLALIQHYPKEIFHRLFSMRETLFLHLSEELSSDHLPDFWIMCLLHTFAEINSFCFSFPAFLFYCAWHQRTSQHPWECEYLGRGGLNFYSSLFFLLILKENKRIYFPIIKIMHYESKTK